MTLTYILVMVVALSTAVLLGRRRLGTLTLTRGQRWGVWMGAFLGAMIFSKLPFVLFDIEGLRSGAAWFESGKTIVFGLVGGYLGVEIAKWLLRVRQKTGDSFVVPVAVAICIGRIGCFVGGCCYGTATDLPWGIRFHDEVTRHPTQLYEAVFHALAAWVFFRMEGTSRLRNQRIKAYILAYLVYRFFSEEIRPEPEVFAGLTAYQIGCLVFIPVFLALWRQDAKLEAPAVG